MPLGVHGRGHGWVATALRLIDRKTVTSGSRNYRSPFISPLNTSFNSSLHDPRRRPGQFHDQHGAHCNKFHEGSLLALHGMLVTTSIYDL